MDAGEAPQVYNSAGPSSSIQQTIMKRLLCARQGARCLMTQGQGLMLLRGINEPTCAKCLGQPSAPIPV